MADPQVALKGTNGAVIAVGALFVLLLSSLVLMGDVAQNSERFEQYFVWLALFYAVVLVPLAIFILWQLGRLIRQYLARRAGSQLTARLVASFLLIALIPAAVVYTFSYRFLTEGVDSWFDVRVDSALADALELSRSSLDLQVRQLARDTQDIVDELENISEVLIPIVLNNLRAQMNAQELTLIGENNRILFSSTDSSTRRLPVPPGPDILWRIEPGQPFSRIERVDDFSSVMRVVAVPGARGLEGDERILQAVYPVDRRMSALASRVEDAFAGYREFAYLRGVIKQGFILTMSLAFAISMMAALWAGLLVARRLIAPIGDLADGTRRVAQGNYGSMLPVRRQDELGFLVQSFNRMTRILRDTRQDAERARRMLESERMYLDTVLHHLRSGVMALDARLHIRTANAAAATIFDVDLVQLRQATLPELAASQPSLAAFHAALAEPLAHPERDWTREITIPSRAGSRVLVVRAAWLPEPVGSQGLHAIVFDDMTDYLRAQRESAWGEVARRLAHEIKNPLTPIRLSAERLSRQLGKVVEGREQEILQRATSTIVQQVDAMKELVNAFRDYAQPPALALQRVSINRIVREVTDLYTADESRHIACHLDEDLPETQLDAGRIRQLLHNLIKNGFEAAQHADPPTVMVATRRCVEVGHPEIELEIVDNGPGVEEGRCQQIFEPYYTDKPKGTGLGLAVAKKVVEEHGGRIGCDNAPGLGARFRIWLPASTAAQPT